MTHRNDRVLSVKELARVEGEGALYIRASGDRVEQARLDIYEPPASSRRSCAAGPTPG
jgi:sulfhydrogenase subunit alpha